MQLERDIPPSCRFSVHLFGPFEVWERSANGVWMLIAKDRWGNNKYPQSVLKRLLAAPGRRLPRWKLIEDIWPSLDRADKYLNNAISILYRIIGKDLIVSREASYELAGQALIQVDSDVCECILKALDSQSDEREQAVPELEKALALLERGIYLEQESGTWCHALRKQFEKLLRQCRSWLAEGYRAQGKYLQADLQYRALLQMMPPDEDALQCWMTMLAQQGKRSEAIQCYQDTKDVVESQGYTLSPATGLFLQQIEAQPMPAPRLVSTPGEIKITSVAEPEQTVSLWQPDQDHPKTALRLVAWATLLQEEQERLATTSDVLYDVLETEIMAMALRWKPSSGSIAVLQQLANATIRKHDAMHNQHSNRDTAITRRHALQAIAMLPIQLYGLSFLPSETRLPPDEVLPLCAAGLTACLELRQYEPEGMQAIQRILAAYLPTLEKLAQQSSPSQGRAAFLTAQGYLLINILADHYGKLDQMEAASRIARRYGQIAHDPNLEVSALTQLAVKFDYERRDRKSLETYQEALELPAFVDVSPLLQGRIYAGLAATHAYCQQPSQALFYLNRAKEVVPTDPQSDPSYLIAFCSQAMLPLWEGLTLKHTNHYTEAANAFSHFGSLTPVSGLMESYRAEHLNYTASVAVKQRELDIACFYLDAAEEVSWTIRHGQRYAEVRDTFRDVQLLWPDEPKVKMLREKLYARQW